MTHTSPTLEAFDPVWQEVWEIESTDVPGEAIYITNEATTVAKVDSIEHARFIVAAPRMAAVLRDVAALLPVAGRLHPEDLMKLQTRVCAVLASTATAQAGDQARSPSGGG